MTALRCLFALAVISLATADVSAQNQTTPTPTAPSVSVAPAAGAKTTTGPGIGMGLSILGVGVGLGLIGSAALSGIARQPEQANNIRGVMILMAALVEGAAIISLVLCLLLIIL